LPVEASTNPREKIVLVYDGECPICRRYSAYIRLRQRVEIELCNARDRPDLVASLLDRGYDLNQGMALLWGEQVHLGRSALRVLDTLTLTSGLLDAPIRCLLRVPGAAFFIYPLCKAIRWIALKATGKNPDLHRLA
jgi:hypothetical protein